MDAAWGPSPPRRSAPTMPVSRTALACAAILSASSLLACSGGEDATTSAGGGGGSGPFVTAPHPEPAQVVTVGGAVLKSPKLQLIAYASDPFLPDVDAFIAELGTT